MTISYQLRPDRNEIRIYLDQMEKVICGPNRYEIKSEISKKDL